MTAILIRLLKAVLGGWASFITDRLEAKASEKVIEQDQTILDQKSVEAKADLARLNELGQLKTTAATGITAAENQVIEDDKAVADTTAKAEVVTAKLKAIPEAKGVTGQQLDDKFKDL